MNSLIYSVVKLILFWARYAASALYSFIQSPTASGAFRFVTSNWKLLCLILCGVGLVADLAVYIFRWQPHKVWISFFRRIRDRRHGIIPVPYPGAGQEEIRMTYDPPEDDVYEVPEGAEPVDVESLQYMDSETETISIIPESPMKVEEKPERTFEKKQRHRWGTMRRTLSSLLSDKDEDTGRVRPAAVPPARDRREAYHAPYIPPQWRRPGQVGTSGGRKDQHQEEP